MDENAAQQRSILPNKFERDFKILYALSIYFDLKLFIFIKETIYIIYY